MPATAEMPGDQPGGATTAHWPLFDVFPELEPVVAVRECASLPTPVQALPFADHAWIKRDDLTHPEYGGNKIRKLEFVAADALRRGARRIVTIGAIGTNHGVATAMICEKLGLDCVIYLFDQPASTTVAKNLKLMQAYGATLVYCGSLFNTVLAYYLSPYRLHRGSYFLFAGGSNVYGTLAFVNAAIELRDQIGRGDCPPIGTIVCPVGSCGTFAGLCYGFQLIGLDIRVLGIRVAREKLGPFAACTTGTVFRLMEAVYRLLRRHSSRPVPYPVMPRLIDDYYGDGYGVPTSSGERALQLFASAGISLEQTYTAKAAAAFLDELEVTDSNVLFWNTYNSRDMSAKADNTGDTAQLPEKLRKVIRETTHYTDSRAVARMT